MGECALYRMLAFKTGALRFEGFANTQPMGEKFGSVNYYQFDNIASLVETSGFLELPDQDNGGMSTVGNTIVEIGFTDDSIRTITRDALFEPPVFWAVSSLTGSLLQSAEWGQEQYDKEIAFFISEYGDNHAMNPIAEQRWVEIDNRIKGYRSSRAFGESNTLFPNEPLATALTKERSEGAEAFVRAMINEAAERKYTIVRLSPSNDSIVIHFRSDGEWIERDCIPIRMWHFVVASIHSLIGARMDITSSDSETTPVLNAVELSGSLPPLQKRRVGFETVQLNVTFSQETIAIEFLPHYPPSHRE